MWIKQWKLGTTTPNIAGDTTKSGLQTLNDGSIMVCNGPNGNPAAIMETLRMTSHSAVFDHSVSAVRRPFWDLIICVKPSGFLKLLLTVSCTTMDYSILKICFNSRKAENSNTNKKVHVLLKCLNWTHNNNHDYIALTFYWRYSWYVYRVSTETICCSGWQVL